MHPHLAIAAAAEERHDDLDQRLLDALRCATARLARAALRDALHMRNERFGEALARLAADGAIIRAGEGWAVPVPASYEEAGTERP